MDGRTLTLSRGGPTLGEPILLLAVFLAGALLASAGWWAVGARSDAPSAGPVPAASQPAPGDAGSGLVAVPVCSHTAPALIHAVTRLYRSQPLTLVHVVEVPSDLPLEAGLPPAEEEELRHMIEELRDAAETDLDAPVAVEILHGRDAARTLLDWIHAHHPGVVVLSLHSQRPDLSPTALSVLRDAHTQVWVWRGRSGEQLEAVSDD